MLTVTCIQKFLEVDINALAHICLQDTIEIVLQQLLR